MSTFHSFARHSHFVDLHYDDEPDLIATGVLESDEGIILVDPGPGVSIPSLVDSLGREGISLRDIRHILITHIHLDHAGAVGELARRNSEIKVHAHEVGAPHLVDPSRLLDSARRIYGDEMETTWGTMEAVPQYQLNVITGQDALKLGNRSFQVVYTPGHAQHHVSFLDDHSGFAFVGDVGGQKTVGVSYIMPVAPPPDVDLPAWSESLSKLEDLSPEGLFLTHFGPSENPNAHIETMRVKLKSWSDRVRDDLEEETHDEELAVTFAEEKLSNLEESLPEEYHRPYKLFAHPAGSWHGIARYWRNL